MLPKTTAVDSNPERIVLKYDYEYALLISVYIKFMEMFVFN